MKRCFVILIFATLIATSANATVTQGNLDLAFAFNFGSEDGTGGAPDRDSLEFSAAVDYFITNRISLGVGIGYEDYDQSGNGVPSERTAKKVSFRAKYHLFKHRRYTPYIGWQYSKYDYDAKRWDTGLGEVESKKDDTGNAILLGFRLDLTEHNDLFIEYQNLSYGDDWPTNTDGGNKIFFGLIHQIK